MSRLKAALAWLLPAGGILASCGWLGLIEPTETRYAEIAREMLESRDWLIPRLNGIPHFHKPPLAYWSSAAGMGLLGVNAWGARIGAALAAGVILWCTARIARHVPSEGVSPDEAAARAPLLLASMVLFFAISHQLASDIFLAAAVAWYYAAIFDPRSRTTIWPYVALGVGFMAKGPVVLVLTAVPVLLASLWARDGALARTLRSRRGWLVFALVALPWYLIVMFRTPGLMTYFLHHQLWQRYTTTLHQRGGPVYYFLLVTLGGTLPWTWPALRELWRSARGRPVEQGATHHRRSEDALLASWVLLPFVFFSFSGSKLPAYVLPVFPALAVLASRASVRGWEAGTGRWGIRSALPMWTIVFTFVGLMALLAAVSPFDSKLGSPRALAETLSKNRLPGEHIVEFGTFNAGIPFYLRETVPMLEVPRDLGFVDPRARALAVITREDLARTVMTSGRVWLVGNPDRIKALANELGFNATYVAGFGDQALLSLATR